MLTGFSCVSGIKEKNPKKGDENPELERGGVIAVVYDRTGSGIWADGLWRAVFPQSGYGILRMIFPLLFYP